MILRGKVSQLKIGTSVRHSKRIAEQRGGAYPAIVSVALRLDVGRWCVRLTMCHKSLHVDAMGYEDQRCFLLLVSLVRSAEFISHGFDAPLTVDLLLWIALL